MSFWDRILITALTKLTGSASVCKDQFHLHPGAPWCSWPQSGRRCMVGMAGSLRIGTAGGCIYRELEGGLGLPCSVLPWWRSVVGDHQGCGCLSLPMPSKLFVSNLFKPAWRFVFTNCWGFWLIVLFSALVSVWKTYLKSCLQTSMVLFILAMGICRGGPDKVTEPS